MAKQRCCSNGSNERHTKQLLLLRVFALTHYYSGQLVAASCTEIILIFVAISNSCRNPEFDDFHVLDSLKKCF